MLCHVCVHTHVYIHECVCVCVYSCACLCAYVCVCVCVLMCMPVCIRVCVSVRQQLHVLPLHIIVRLVMVGRIVAAERKQKTVGI